ncbi:unnamed protein product [Mytilus edulis]|uniref:DDE-1 domain-containing protein n=1 Tax=Mytilus edulis TaxID=6550 RepID=A0A8S3V8W6_MYTED|nr:unnamed protein product [Mytilus edulis]
MCGKVGLWLCLVVYVLGADYQVTIYPSYLSQGGRTHFEIDRWDGHNGLDSAHFIDKANSIATDSGRWLNRDLNGQTFQNAPLAMGNSNNGDVLVLLHNYDRAQARIQLNFDHHWFTPSSGFSRCHYLNSHRQPVLEEWKSMHVSNGYVTVPADGSCIFVFHAKYNFHNIHTIKESTYYGNKMVMRIQKDCAICIFSCASCTYAATANVNVHSLGNVQYARLRIGVSLPGKSGGNPTPKTVLINNHHVTAFYQLFAPGRGHEDTRWEIYEYRIPANFYVQIPMRQEVTDLATDFAHTIKIKPRNEEFTLRWFEGFIKRWPELRVVKPRSLEILRAKCGSVANVEKYFASLKEVVLKYNLQDKPHLIFNVDEKGITLNHKPPTVVSGIKCTTSAVTHGRSSTTTILGCGSASGFAVPPYFVFEGKRMNNEWMNGATPGAVGAVSDSGWSNTNIFRQYLTDHFLKHILGRNNDNVLHLLYGHKSHVAVDIIECAQEHHIIIHVLPAHTSHILQPLDVGCYWPLQRIYDNECHKTIRQNSSVITKYNICELACKAYQKALSPENLQSVSIKKDWNIPPR